jgi:hypothetical protein
VRARVDEARAEEEGGGGGGGGGCVWKERGGPEELLGTNKG